ncbi:MAG: class I SAM-dependent methyltransferase [Actinomycetia bacterium]|nr:class I SAM-dependent methyltransferase [Actinomycetes bacterium]
MPPSDRDHWNTRYAERPWPQNVSPWLVSQRDALPRPGTALDIAGGTGRNALWLADLGWSVTITDVSDVALTMASNRAAVSGTEIVTRLIDLTESPLPHGPWNLILLFHYLDRNLIRAIRPILAPDGVLIGALATRKNLERNERPPASFLLEDGELPQVLVGFDLIAYEEGWQDDRHDARFIARRGSDF